MSVDTVKFQRSYSILGLVLQCLQHLIQSSGLEGVQLGRCS